MKTAVHSVQNVVGKTIIASGLYLGILASGQLANNAVSTPIRTQSQLETLLAEQRIRLAGKIDSDTIIRAFLRISEDEISQAIKTGSKEYAIILGKMGANEGSLRHELYHIADGHCDAMGITSYRAERMLKYLFWYEPKATIYEWTGFML